LQHQFQNKLLNDNIGEDCSINLTLNNNHLSIKITIPTPCHEDWNKMTPNNIGKYCDVCCKTVVDFTTWQPQQILLHFESNTNVCGRFNPAQLDEPLPTVEDFVKQISYFSIPFLKKVAAILLFVFFIVGSNNKALAQGAPMVMKQDSVKKKGVALKDSLINVNKSDTTHYYSNAIFQTESSLKTTFLINKKRKTPKRKHKSTKKKLASNLYFLPATMGYTFTEKKK
jgi:hypothetical protein